MMTPEEKLVYNRERLRRWRVKNADRLRAQRMKNRDNERAACRRYYAKNREAQIARVVAWRKENLDKSGEYLKKRQRRTPGWIEQKELKNIYLKCPRGLHVDHIVPLDGFTVEGYPITGLHVPWNLWYLTPAENAQKGSRMRRKDHVAIDATNPLFIMPKPKKRLLPVSRETRIPEDASNPSVSAPSGGR